MIVDALGDRYSRPAVRACLGLSKSNYYYARASLKSEDKHYELHRTIRNIFVEKDKCTSFSYGRCIYTKPTWDLRLFNVVPRGTDEWKTRMKSRTTSKRVNKRILNDYGLALSKTRGKKHTFWWSLVHSLNVLLDARLKVSKLSFISLLEGTLSIVA